MAIRNDLSSLPTASASSGGWAPDDGSLFGPILIERLKTLKGEREAKKRHYIRPSDALDCARKVGYIAAGIEGAPMDAPGWWVTSLGTIIHELLDPAIVDHFGEHASTEHMIGTPILDDDGNRVGIEPHVVEVRGVEVSVVSFIDLWLHHPAHPSTAWDYKSVGGYAYKLAVGERNEPEGPKRSALIQAGIGALLVDAERVGVLNLARDAISVDTARRKGFDEYRRFLAEWTVALDDIRDEVEAEILRLWKINRLVHDDGFLPIRKVPGLGGEITDPRNGAWQVWATENDEPRLVATGNYWGCDYCSHRDVCIADGPGRVEIRGRS